MTDDEIRERVRAGFADGTLQRRSSGFSSMLRADDPVAKPTLADGGFADRCVICGESPTQRRVAARSSMIAFHNQCYEIWVEEADRAG